MASQRTRRKPTIALTFDDGPDPTYTPQILEILSRHQVPATFFFLGQAVKRHPDLAKQASRQGHLIANHSWSHPHLTTLSPRKIRRELKTTSAILKKTTRSKGKAGGNCLCTAISLPFSRKHHDETGSTKVSKYFRPPYGERNDTVVKVAAEMGLTPSLWTIDTRDWEPPQGGADEIVDKVLRQAADRAVVLFHDGGGDRFATVSALSRIITGLGEKGFEFVTLGEENNVADAEW